MKNRRPLPRPKQTRSIATRHAILDATSQLARDRGITKITTRDVAQRAGVSTGTLYQYFPSRESLEAAWELRELDRALVTVADVVRDLFERPVSIEEGITVVARAAIDLTERHLRAFGRHELGTRWADRSPMVTLFGEFIAGALRASSDRRRLYETDYEIAAEFVILFIVQGTLRLSSRAGVSEARRERMRDELVRAVVRYLVEPPRDRDGREGEPTAA
jgi:AcrR family transcriptional regulator